MKIALITEGVSEHRVIKHIVSKSLSEFDIIINQIQPQIINNKQSNTGGWNEVLKYCEREEIESILIENDYLIIQIDTDQSQTHPFSINHKDKAPSQIHSEVLQKLSGLIKPNILKKYNDRILFAICIHTIECWLLPIFYTSNNRIKTTGCISTLNVELKRKNIGSLPIKGKNSINSIRVYESILGNYWKRKQDIVHCSQYNHGFSHFITILNSIAVGQQ